MPMPVSPRMTAPGTHPPLGVTSKMLPSLSMTAMCVVSFDTPVESSLGVGTVNESDSARVDVSPARMSAFQ